MEKINENKDSEAAAAPGADQSEAKDDLAEKFEECLQIPNDQDSDDDKNKAVNIEDL